MMRRLLLLNGIAILNVILFHAAGWGFVGMFAWAHRYLPAGSATYDQHGSAAYYLLRVVEQAAVFAIPAFLFVSGVFIAFAAGRTRATISWKVVGIRIRDLVIPYFFWSVALFVLLHVEGTTFAPLGYLELLLTGRTNPAYYYVPLLCQFYLLSPLIVLLARRSWLPLLVGAALIQLAVQALYYPVLLGIEVPTLQPFLDIVPKWFFPSRIFWFAAGVVAGFHLKTLEQWLPRLRWGLLASALILLPLGVLEWEAMLRLSGREWIDHRETIVDTLYSVSVVLCFLAFTKVRVPGAAHLDDVGSKSFGIYIVHSPVMEIVARGLYHAAPWVLGYQILFQPLLIVFGLGIPLLIMATMNRSPLRPYYRFSFG